MGTLAWIGAGAVCVLVVGWLVTSFSAPSRGREVVEWTSATAAFVALLTLFVNLFLRAREADSIAGLVGFGFLGLLFASGTLVSLVQTLRATRGAGKGEASATN